MFMKKLIVSMLIIYLLISMVGCGGVPTAPPISSESELILVRVTDPKSDLIFIAGKENEYAMAVLGNKNTEGNPIDIMGSVYVSEQGDSFVIEAGIDGLPTYLIDSEGNKVIFENYTNSTVDISIYDSSGSLIQDTITINLDPTDLLELKQLYNSFYSKGLKWSTENTADVLKWGAVSLNVIVCVGVIYGVYQTAGVLALTPAVGWACGKAIFSTIAAVTPTDIDNSISMVVGGGSCLISGSGCDSAALSLMSWAIEEGGSINHAPIISSLTVNPSSININETTAITCTASDEDVGDTLTYTWTKTDGTFEGSTTGATVTWKAPPTQGNYTVTCEVSDGEASDSDQVIISVGDVNHPPVITSIAVTSATKGQAYSYDVNATDSDDDTLVYSLTTKPSGMTINSSTGLITWTPTATGSFGVTVKASDGELFNTQSFTITVEETSTTLGQVQLSSPYNGTTVNTSTVTLSWSFVSGATGYEVVYDTSSSFTNPIGWSVSGTSKTTGTLTDGTTYYWRVRAFAGSQYSSWSSVWSFTKSGAIVPQNVTLTLYICENSTSGPLLSGVSIGIVDGGGNSFSQTTNSSGYVTITGTPGTWYFSASKSGYDTNSWSQSITTNCTKFGYIVKSATPVGAIDVFATLDGSAWFGSLSYSLTGPSSLSGSTVPAILSNKPVGSYSIAFNSGGPSNASLSSITPSNTQTLSEGGIVAFTLNFTGSTLPPVPTPLSPGTTSAPGPTISTLTPTLQWQTVSNADYYNLSISIYPYGTSNIIYNPQQIYGNSITVPSGTLEAGKKYRWNMRAHNSAGFSEYSITLYFQT